MNPRIDLSTEAGWVVIRSAPTEPGGLSASSASPEPGPAGGNRSLTKVTRGPVLVVDDEKTIREIVAETLELEGYSVVQAADGAEALRRIDEQRPSVVLLDMRMPGLDGWGVVRTLKERGIVVPIVVVTAASSAKDWATEIGAAGYLAKPFDDTQLLGIVERFAGPANPGAYS
jgi:CheY-like chemotaxis protein